MGSQTAISIHRYSTTIHCSSCVQRLSAVLEEAQGVARWEADANSPERWVTIIGTLSDAEARAAIRRAGLEVRDERGVPEGGVHHSSFRSEASGFWANGGVWRRASFNTLSCLVGCTIGDFAMIVYLQAFHPGAHMATQMVLAIIAGLITSITLETILMRHREQLPWMRAFRMAMGMSFLSMVGMEVAMNLTDFMITGGGLALSDPGYWLAFIPAAVVGFLAPLPYNYHQLQKHGKACH